MSTNTIIGYSHIDYDEHSDMHWYGIYIDRDYRGKQYGKILTSYIHLLCKYIGGINSLFLAVDIDNTIAYHIYQTHNYILHKVCEKCHILKKNLVE